MRSLAGTALAAGALALMPAAGQAQGAQNHFLSVGDKAPDIQVVGSTRYGTLKDPIHLSDFKGETVVVAFYFKARTPG
jgi:thioredoxin-dependent peroxiredoxin